VHDRRSLLRMALLVALAALPPGRLGAAAARTSAAGGTVLVRGWILTQADLRALGDG
jgi:hypothetical protein